MGLAWRLPGGVVGDYGNSGGSLVALPLSGFVSGARLRPSASDLEDPEAAFARLAEFGYNPRDTIDQRRSQRARSTSFRATFT